jgi:hypothetical protein
MKVLTNFSSNWIELVVNSLTRTDNKKNYPEKSGKYAKNPDILKIISVHSDEQVDSRNQLQVVEVLQCSLLVEGLATKNISGKKGL